MASLRAVSGAEAELLRIDASFCPELHATELCRGLLDAGAPGLHFYTMNRAAATLEVCATLGWEPAALG